MEVSSHKYEKQRRELEHTYEELNAARKELSELNKIMEDKNRTLNDTYSKLLASEENFRQLAENTNEVIWLRNEKEFIYINNQFENIWGRKKEEVLNNPRILSEWFYPEDRGNIDLWFGFSDIVSGQPLIEQYRIIKPDKDIRWLLTRSFLIEDKEGEPYRIVSITSDITEQKDFENTLQIAKEKAQESDLLKTTFLANISAVNFFHAGR